MVKNLMRTLLCGACVAIAAAAPAAMAQGEVGPDGLADAQLSSFVALAKSAAKDSNPAGLAELSQFPLVFNCSGKSRAVSRSEFIAKGEAALSKGDREAIASQEVGSMLRNSQGAMFGDGQVWIKAICVDSKCLASKPLIAVVNSCWK